jgi:hypothetical protein
MRGAVQTNGDNEVWNLAKDAVHYDAIVAVMHLREVRRGVGVLARGGPGPWSRSREPTAVFFPASRAANGVPITVCVCCVPIPCRFMRLVCASTQWRRPCCSLLCPPVVC